MDLPDAFVGNVTDVTTLVCAECSNAIEDALTGTVLTRLSGLFETGMVNIPHSKTGMAIIDFKRREYDGQLSCLASQSGHIPARIELD
jgi:hypothetical protein